MATRGVQVAGKLTMVHPLAPLPGDIAMPIDAFVGEPSVRTPHVYVGGT